MVLKMMAYSFELASSFCRRMVLTSVSAILSIVSSLRISTLSTMGMVL